MMDVGIVDLSVVGRSRVAYRESGVEQSNETM